MARGPQELFEQLRPFIQQLVDGAHIDDGTGAPVTPGGQAPGDGEITPPPPPNSPSPYFPHDSTSPGVDVFDQSVGEWRRLVMRNGKLYMDLWYNTTPPTELEPGSPGIQIPEL